MLDATARSVCSEGYFHYGVDVLVINLLNKSGSRMIYDRMLSVVLFLE